MRSLGPREGHHHQPGSPREETEQSQVSERELLGGCKRWKDASGATLWQKGRNAGLGEAVLVSQDGAIPPQRDPLG